MINLRKCISPSDVSFKIYPRICQKKSSKTPSNHAWAKTPEQFLRLLLWKGAGFQAKGISLPVSSPRDTGSRWVFLWPMFLTWYIESRVDSPGQFHITSCRCGLDDTFLKIPQESSNEMPFAQLENFPNKEDPPSLSLQFGLYILSTLHVSRTSSFIHQSEKKPPLSSFGNDCTTRPGVQRG